MLFLDPPDHTRVRGVFAKTFTPRSIERLRARIQLVTDKRLDRMATAGGGDLIAELAYPLPVIVIAELLGFPPEDFPKLKQWSDDMAGALALRPTVEQQIKAAAAREEMRVYFDGVVATLRARPGDNLLSALLDLTSGPGGDDRLSPEELFANCVLLLAAGHETTTNLIGNGMLALLRNPDQLANLRADPTLIDSAVDELLRYDAPVQWVTRVAGEDIPLTGGTLPAGAVVLASIGSGNRDPAQFTAPDRLDLRRPDNKHLSFGSGIHFCLGAALARMEGTIAIGSLVARLPTLRLDNHRPRWRGGVIFRGLHSLPVST